MIIGANLANVTKEGKITFDNLKSNVNACLNDVGDCDWLQYVMN
jgi:hypothetical protein